MLTQAEAKIEKPFPLTRVSLCVHCGNFVPEGKIQFCCEGCKTVYTLLKNMGLDDYYDRKQNSESFRRALPVKRIREGNENPFQFLDDSEYRKELGIHADRPSLQFYLEGIHCSACLWLIEKLNEMLPEHVVSARVDVQNSVVKVEITEKGSFARVAMALDDLGYRPHPIANSFDQEKLKLSDRRSLLTRVAIAGAMSGNIMIFSISIYAGATGIIRDRFDWITLFLSLPVFLYSAVPLYQNTYQAFKRKTWSVDVPIVIAVLSGFGVSVWSIVTGGSQNYLDSLSGLIFLLLTSRYLLLRVQDNAFQHLDETHSYFPVKILKSNNEWVWVRDLIVGDVVSVPPLCRVPVDGVVVDGVSSINHSLMTGEGLPSQVKVGSEVLAGTQNLEGTISVRVVKGQADSRLGQILTELKNFNPKSNAVARLTDQTGKFFTLVLPLFAFLLFVGYAIQGNASEGIRRALTVLIVSCPCALAFATPLTLLRAHALALKNGIFVRDMGVLDALRQLKRVVFDKTGTLTYGVLKVDEVQKFVSDDEFKLALAALASIETDQKHPISKAVVAYIASFFPELKNSIPHSEKVEWVTGRGLRGFVNGICYEAYQWESDRSAILLSKEGKRIAIFHFEDEIRSEGRALVQTLKSRGLKVGLLSGDSDLAVERVRAALQIDPNASFARMTPESKANWISAHEGTLFVGDGANDSLALKRADVGVATQGALDLSLKAASVYLTEGSLQGLATLFKIADGTRSLLIRHLAFTLCYNAFVLTLAVTGRLTPLFAAVLMPASSLFVLFSTLFGNREWRNMGRASG